MVLLIFHMSHLSDVIIFMQTPTHHYETKLLIITIHHGLYLNIFSPKLSCIGFACYVFKEIVYCICLLFYFKSDPFTYYKADLHEAN